MAIPVMLKAALPAIPGVNQLPGIKKTGGALPDLTLERNDVVVERGEVDRYAAVCGFPKKDVAPVPYLHMLAFPLHMQLMTDAAFPFPAIGSVHLENSITQHRPVAIGETVSLSLRADNLRDSTKGRAWDMNVVATVGDEVVWESVSTYLRVGKGDKENGDPGTSFTAIDAKGPVWSLPGQPRPHLRRRVGRPQPDPPLPADGQGTGVPAPHRARHVEQGPLHRGPREPAARPGPRGGRLQEADLPPGQGALRRRGQPGRLGLRTRQPEVGCPPPAGAYDGALIRPDAVAQP